MEYKNNVFVVGSPWVIDDNDSTSIRVNVFFKENNAPIMNRIGEELVTMFETFNISVFTNTLVSEIVTHINYETFKCGLIIDLNIPKNVEISINTLDMIQEAISAIIKLAIDVQKTHDRRYGINKDLKVLKPSTPAKKEKCDQRCQRKRS